jgi:hypothetical protein
MFEESLEVAERECGRGDVGKRLGRESSGGGKTSEKFKVEI